MSEQDVPAPQTDHEAPSPKGRRGFVQVLAGLVSIVVGIIPMGVGLGFFLDPLLRKRQLTNHDPDPAGSARDKDGFTLINVTVDSLPMNGAPVAVKVKADKVDAWNRFENIDVGTVWLRRTSEGNVLAMSAICPHLGCAVDFRPSDNDFFCPCHTSVFNLDGDRTNQIPPRGMDHLETQFKSETGNQIWLKYETFRSGTPEKEPIT